MAKHIEPEEEIEEFDAEKILREARREFKPKEKIVASDKAKAEFRRVPTYNVAKCYKFETIVCSKKCLLWNDCIHKGGK